MTIEKLLEQEKQNYINGIAIRMFDTDDKEYSNREIKEAYWLSVPPPAEKDNTLWLDIPEIEIPLSIINNDELDDVTINGDYAYISTGYGLMIEFE